MSHSASEKLRRFYQQFLSDDHVLIMINADPDSMASAMAIKRLLWRKVSQIVIATINIIKRSDNIAMVRLLGINLSHMDKIDLSMFNRFVIVDSQPAHSPAFQKVTFDVVIDHHPNTGITAPFVDIRPEYGANSSILTEYLRAAKIKLSAKLATALFYAIKTDTSNFERQTIMEDIRAFQFLFRHANMHLARRFEQADLSMDFLKYFKRAIEDKYVHRKRCYVHLGPVVSPDICVIIADFLMRINTVNWTIVSGTYDKKLIIIFRNDGNRKNAGKTAETSFGQFGSAGGHKSMARAEIPLSAIKDTVDCRNDKNMGKWVACQIEKGTSKKRKTKSKPS